MSKHAGVLCVFSRTPVAGRVKTRLIPALGAARTTALYQTLLTQTLTTAHAAGMAALRLYCTPKIDHPFLQACAGRFDLQLCLQQGADLGERMRQALAAGLQEFAYALVIGCDCPWLQTRDIDQACARLAAGTEVVLGPAKDGGYYLLGLRSAQDHLFSDMLWGSATVLQETRQRLSAAGIGWHELAEYADIDRPEDLAAYEKLAQP